jgi:predicted O-methyltransferase YrrM
MSYKNYLMRRFIPVLMSDFRLFLKYLFRYTEEQNSRQRVKKQGYEKGLPSIDLTDIFPDLNETIHHYTYLDDTSRVTDIVLLKGLAKQFPACDYLEIGSWRGESIINVVEHTKTCVSLSLSDKQMKELGFKDKQIELNRFFIKNNPKITHIEANSQTFDFSTLNQKFDLIFVDGDHHFDAVIKDSQNAFKLLKDKNSIIVWHDYGNSYESTRWEVFDAILSGIPAEKRKNLYKVSNTLCAIYTERPFPSKIIEFPEIPQKVFTVNISAQKL